jgi:hypothetical protein
LATGQGNWGLIALDAALTFVPGGVLTKMIGAPFKAGGRLLTRVAPEVAEALAHGATAASSAIKQGVYQASRLLPRTQALERMAAEINNLPAAVGRWTVGRAPNVGFTAAERKVTQALGSGSTPEQAWSALTQVEKDAVRAAQRRRFWTNVDQKLTNDQAFADQYGHLFTDAEKASFPTAPKVFDPVRKVDVPMQLSHEPVPISLGGGAQVPRAPWQHAAYDPAGLKYPDALYLGDWLRTGRFAPVLPTGAGVPPTTDPANQNPTNQTAAPR